jgi:hypothetical protein
MYVLYMYIYVRMYYVRTYVCMYLRLFTGAVNITVL